MTPEAYEDMARVQDAHWWYAARRDVLKQQLACLNLPRSTEILEIGCGTGANLQVLAAFGRVTGLEMSPRAVTCARATAPRIRIVEGRCPQDLCKLAQRFDLICLLDVLEHLPADSDVLAQLAGMLNPGGRMLITVPAYRWLWGPHDTYHHHLRRYDRRALRAACVQAGLTVSRMSHFNTLLFPVALVQRLALRRRPSATASVTVPPTPLNWLLTRVFALERHVVPRFDLPFGLSLMAIAAPAAH